MVLVFPSGANPTFQEQNTLAEGTFFHYPCGDHLHVGGFFFACREGEALELQEACPSGAKDRLCCGTRSLSRFAPNLLRQSSHPSGPAYLTLHGCRRLLSSWPTKVGHLLLKSPAPASFANRAAPPRRRKISLRQQKKTAQRQTKKPAWTAS